MKYNDGRLPKVARFEILPMVKIPCLSKIGRLADSEPRPGPRDWAGAVCASVVALRT